MSNEEELRQVLNETAQELSRTQSNPRTWLSWIIYWLARLEDKATNQSPAGKEAYTDMLSALQDEIRNRLRTGGWH
jgi:hypothetical protein